MCCHAVRNSPGDKPVVEVQVGSENKRFTSEEISAAVSDYVPGLVFSMLVIQCWSCS